MVEIKVNSVEYLNLVSLGFPPALPNFMSRSRRASGRDSPLTRKSYPRLIPVAKEKAIFDGLQPLALSGSWIPEGIISLNTSVALSTIVVSVAKSTVNSSPLSVTAQTLYILPQSTLGHFMNPTNISAPQTQRNLWAAVACAESLNSPASFTCFS